VEALWSGFDQEARVGLACSQQPLCSACSGRCDVLMLSVCLHPSLRLSTQPPPAAYRAAPPRFTLSTASINAPANAGPSARVSLWLAPEVTLPPAQGAALSAAPAVPAAATPVPTATVRVPAAAAGAAKQCAVCGKSRREGNKPLLKCSRCKAAYCESA